MGRHVRACAASTRVVAAGRRAGGREGGRADRQTTVPGRMSCDGKAYLIQRPSTNFTVCCFSSASISARTPFGRISVLRSCPSLSDRVCIPNGCIPLMSDMGETFILGAAVADLSPSIRKRLVQTGRAQPHASRAHATCMFVPCELQTRSMYVCGMYSACSVACMLGVCYMRATRMPSDMRSSTSRPPGQSSHQMEYCPSALHTTANILYSVAIVSARSESSAGGTAPNYRRSPLQPHS